MSTIRSKYKDERKKIDSGTISSDEEDKKKKKKGKSDKGKSKEDEDSYSDSDNALRTESDQESLDAGDIKAVDKKSSLKSTVGRQGTTHPKKVDFDKVAKGEDF